MNGSYKIEKKKILCMNYIKKKECRYDQKCKYAHGLSDQNIDIYRKDIYELISNNTDLKELDIYDNVKLYKILLIHTQICEKCKENMCPGGYNCKNGIFDTKYLICKDDLIEGNCKKCNKIHLTDRNLRCINELKKNKSNSIKNIIIESESLNKSELSDSTTDCESMYSDSDSEPKSIFIN